jgi:hypothetical protein
MAPSALHRMFELHSSPFIHRDDLILSPKGGLLVEQSTVVLMDDGVDQMLDVLVASPCGQICCGAGFIGSDAPQEGTECDP